MESKEYRDLNEKEQKQVDEIMLEGEITDSEEFEDDAVIAQKIKNGEIMSVKLIEKFKLLSEKKLKKIKQEVLVDFGKNISVDVLDADKIKITIGKEEVIVTDKQAKKIISNGFGDRKFASVTGVCKKETWEIKDKKNKIKGIIVAGIGVIVVGIPIIIQGCNGCIQRIHPNPDPAPGYNEVVETIPSSDPIYDPSILPTEDPEIEEYNVDDIIKQMKNVYWVPNIQQQNDWSALDDEMVLNLSAHKTADDINKEMQENQKLIKDIMKFSNKYENKKLTESQYEQCIQEAKDLINRINLMLNSAHNTLELAEVLNSKVIQAGIPHSGDLETESNMRKAALNSIDLTQQQMEEIEKELNTGGKTI